MNDSQARIPETPVPRAESMSASVRGILGRAVPGALVSAVYLGAFAFTWSRSAEAVMWHIDTQVGFGGLGYFTTAALISAGFTIALTAVWALLDVPVSGPHTATVTVHSTRTRRTAVLSRVPRNATAAQVIALLMAMTSNAAMLFATLLYFDGFDRPAVTLDEHIGARMWMMGQTAIAATFYLAYAITVRMRRVPAPSRTRHFAVGCLPAALIVILGVALDASEAAH